MSRRTACDLAIVGAGPAGLAAAIEAARCGVDVVLLDEHGAPGGQIYRAVERAAPALCAILGPDYAAGAALVEDFRQSKTAYWPDATVWRLDPDGRLAYSRDGDAALLKARRVIAATGAMERPVPIPGWTLPGVMGAGAAQVLMKSSALVPDGDVVVAGAGPLLLLVACQLLDAGAHVTAVVETTAAGDYFRAAAHLPGALPAAAYLRKGLALHARLRRAGVPLWRAATDLRAEGDDRVRALSFASGGQTRRIGADTLLLHVGVVPNVQITRQVGCTHEWHDAQRHWRPVLDGWGRTSVDVLSVAGDGGGILGAEAAARSGALAGLAAACDLGRIDAARRDELAAPHLRARRRHAAIRPLLDALYPPPPELCRPADDATVACRCEEVTAGMVRAAVRDGATGPNQVKAYTRAGMGPCQSRMCGLTVAEIVADARGLPVAEIGTLRIRPPIKPVTLGEIAAMEEV